MTPRLVSEYLGALCFEQKALFFNIVQQIWKNENFPLSEL